MKNKVYLGLGSNIGNRAENIISALSFLHSSGFADIKKISSFYETSAVGPKQRNFYNIAAEAETVLNPFDLLIMIKQAEGLLGRKQAKRWGPRAIDIDILFYGNKIISDSSLKIPHKEIQNRLFALAPLSEIASDFYHPILHRKIKDIYKSGLLTLNDQKIKIIKQ